MISLRTRMDEIPLWFKPFYFCYGWTLGLALRFYFLLIYYTSRIERDYTEKGPVIRTLWHEHLALYFSTHPHHERDAWLMHPAWYMRGVYLAMWFSGIRHFFYGSSGNDGRHAADQLIQHLKEGYSTTFAPDGPYGPFHEAKNGILHISEASGVPILPLRFKASFGMRAPWGDHRTFPFPFGKIRVEAGPLIEVRGKNLEACKRSLERALTAGD